MCSKEQVSIEIRSVYGRNKAYPVSDTAKIFSNMLGSKTLTRADLQHINSLGYIVETVNVAASWQSAVLD